MQQNDLEFVIPGDSDTYTDLDIKLYVRGQLVASSGNDLDLTDTTTVTNNLLLSYFISVQSRSTETLSRNLICSSIIITATTLSLS